jgi:hypothetical protein
MKFSTCTTERENIILVAKTTKKISYVFKNQSFMMGFVYGGCSFTVRKKVRYRFYECGPVYQMVHYILNVL